MRIITSSTVATGLAVLVTGALPVLVAPAVAAGSVEAAGASLGVPATPRAAATQGIPTLVAIRASHRAGRDRVVFEFDGPLPAQRSVTYVDRLIADGSGLRVPVAGRAILQARFSYANAHDEAGQPTAPDQVAYATPNVVQVVRSGDFEAVTTYGIGLASRQPVRVTTMTNPSRVVVDVAAGFRTTPGRVWMLNTTNFAKGREPYFTPVRRPLLATSPAAGALDRVFAGPTAAEKRAGLANVLSKATGFSNLRIASGIARVQLTGGCSSGGSTATIAGQITPTLKQFGSVRAVKIYDPSGRTGRPAGRSDSIPGCLEP